MQAMVVVYLMIAAGLALMITGPVASAAAYPTELTIGLQNDMTSMNYFDPATNTVWKAYMVEWGWESLMFHDPSFQSFAYLADPAYGGGNGYTIDASGLNVTVQIRSGVTFHDGQALTADDVVFTYQTLGWSTYATYITDPLWWPTAKYPLWNSTLPTTDPMYCASCKSHVGVEKLSSTQVVFHLTKSYALFFYLTLETPVIPEHIWKSHINAAPQVDPITPTNKVTDSFDRSIDFGFGTQPSQTAATIGTGMFKFDYWVRSQYSHISAYANYWGKASGASHSWQGTVYPFAPKYLQSIKFVIYTSLDVISLALQKGEIDTLIWPLTPGFLTQIQTNPSVSVQQVTDEGYYYLAFNLRKAPWNNLTLRKAISMAIDKDYIVKTLLGGFGVKGYVPIAITNSNYINQSAQTPGFDLAGAAALLDAANIRVNPATGFRQMPDGTPIVASILTPPKDYDPVRADAGIMIANNLKTIGLNIGSAPTSFDTIVAKAFTPPVDFDIYILGWLLGDFPESYVCSFFCSSQDVNINPAGSNSPGYHNALVDAKIAQALVTVDNQARYNLIKDVEGQIVHDLPWNVLYYRKNLNAFRNDRWVGWVNTPPQLYNFWSLANLAPAGIAAPPPPPVQGAFSVAMTVPGQARYGTQVPVQVVVAQGNAPVSGASVVVNVTYGSQHQLLTGTTGAGGSVAFTWSVPLVLGTVQMTATATLGTQTAVATKEIAISIGPPAPVAVLNLTTATPVIKVGQTAQITATLVDGTRSPLAGYNLSIDKALLLGSVTPLYGNTNAQGQLVFTYHAPANTSKFPHEHLVDFVRAKVSVPDTIAQESQTATAAMWVYNTNSPDFRIVTVQGTPHLNLSSAGLTNAETNVTVKVTNWTNLYSGSTAGLAGKIVEAVLPGAAQGNWNVTVAASQVTTDTNGLATFRFSTTASARTNHNVTSVSARFQVLNDPDQATDAVELGVSSATVNGYSAYVSLSNHTLDSAPTAGTSAATVTVLGPNGLPAAGMPVILQILYGPLGLPAQFPWGFDYGTPAYDSTGLNGLDLNMFGQGSIGGSFASSARNWAVLNTGATVPDKTIQYGVENFVEDYEVIGDFSTIDGCDPSGNATAQNGLNDAFGLTRLMSWENTAGLEGITSTAPGMKYFLNVTSTTDATGKLSVDLTAVPHKLDNVVQVIAYVGNPASATPMRIMADSCAFTATIQNAMFRVDSGLIVRRAPVFAMGSAWTENPVMTNLNRETTVHAKFYELNVATGTDVPVPANTQVFMTRGAGSAARNVALTTSRTGTFFGTLTTTAGGWLNWTVADQYTKVRVFNYNVYPWTFSTQPNPPLGSSQGITYSFVPADPAFAYGGREQLFSGTNNLNAYGCDYCDFWSSPAFSVLLAKVPYTLVEPYMYIPTTSVFATVTVDKSLVPLGGSATATFTVTDIYGKPIVNATVWSGPYQAITDANGKANITFTASSGAVENLATIVTPAGYSTRVWYSAMASVPVVTYSALSVAAATAGTTSTINVTITNTLPIAGNVTVVLVVDNRTVAVQTVSVGASASKQVTFQYVFGSSGSHSVAVGTTSANATVPAVVTPPAPAEAGWALAIGLLVAGVVVGVLVGMLLARRRKQPPAMSEEPPREEPAKPAEEELPPDDKL